MEDILAGAAWTPAEDDVLLNLWLEGMGEGTVASLMRRPLDTVRNRIWKLSTAYGQCSRYKPGKGRRRRSGPLSLREKKMVDLALRGEGQKRDQPVLRDFIAKVLCRNIADINQYEDQRLRLERKGFFE